MQIIDKHQGYSIILSCRVLYLMNLVKVLIVNYHELIFQNEIKIFDVLYG